MAKKLSVKPGVVIDAKIVWAAAVAAQRINQSYVKKGDSWEVNFIPETDAEKESYLGNSVPLVRYDFPYRIPNGSLMKILLEENNQKYITVKDFERGEEVKSHFSMKMMELFGEVNAFTRGAVECTVKDSFNMQQDYLQLGTIAYLPKSMELEIARDKRNEDLGDVAVDCSFHTLAIGKRISGQAKIATSSFSSKWNSWLINAVLDTKLVFFFSQDEYKKDENVSLAGTIKKIDGKIATLSRIKISRLDNC